MRISPVRGTGFTISGAGFSSCVRVDTHMKNSPRINTKVAVANKDEASQTLMLMVLVAFSVVSAFAVVQMAVAAFLALTS